MQKSPYDMTIAIAVLCVIINYPVLPILAYDRQQQQQRQDLFPFSYPTTATTTTTSKNETNNDIRSESATFHTLSSHDKKMQNDNADVNYNDNVATNDNGDDNAADVKDSDNNNVDVNNPSSYSSSSSSTDNNDTPKVVILNFYDNDIGQFTNAKPILDKFGFKSTFFIVCSWASSDNNPDRMNWQQITQLYREGHDIESHSTSHKVLSKLSADDLDYQVGQSKECFRKHIGVEPTVFSPPHSKGWNNATVIDMIAKYYDLSIGGFVSSPMFLHCYGWKQLQHAPQTDCRTYSDDGELNYANRYDIKEVSHDGLENRYAHDDNQTFEKFVELVNSQTNYNKDGKINAIPIIGYHDIDNNKTITSTDVNLFDAEMKYLHDNGFKVLTMSDLAYNENKNYLYVKTDNLS
jgi:peptidoglycan/xylan/chitin deacetylase (PgdA/CDA1 family)